MKPRVEHVGELPAFEVGRRVSTGGEKTKKNKKKTKKKLKLKQSMLG